MPESNSAKPRVAVIGLGSMGFGMATSLRRAGFAVTGCDVSAGAVYATLDRLEVKGFSSSRLAPGTAIRGGRPRRYYALTPAGVEALNDAKSAADTLWHGLSWPLKVRT